MFALSADRCHVCIFTSELSSSVSLILTFPVSSVEFILTQSIVAKSSFSFQSMNETKDRSNMLKPAEFHNFHHRVKNRKRILRKQTSQIHHFSPFITNQCPSTRSEVRGQLTLNVLTEQVWILFPSRCCGNISV